MKEKIILLRDEPAEGNESTKRVVRGMSDYYLVEVKTRYCGGKEERRKGGGGHEKRSGGD